jgi:DNA helicase II / ATP-dependent DNA helicase PcrA
MAMHAAAGLSFRHVYVLGLQSSRMPGARRQAIEPIPDALLHEALPPDTRAAHVAEMRRLLHVAMTRAREGLVLAFAARSDGGALQPPSPFAEEARAALGAQWEDREEELFGPDETVHATFQALRDELLQSIPRTGSRLGELRLDTDLDVAHGAVRYLELLKLAGLMARGQGQSVADALPGINAAILRAATPEQREILQTSSLDDLLLDAERDARARAAAIAARDEPSLEPFLPTRGDGLMLSASDIETYRTCPLKYKFARVFRIPSEPTVNQRFGIVVHQVLERYHSSGGRTLDELLGLLDAGWRRGGFGASDEERPLRVKADTSLRRYHDRTLADDAEPMWFEKPFQFKLGAHTLRGRVDRVDRLPDGGYELIDYKTGRPKSATQLREDVQLALYSVAAAEAWDLDASQQAYLYVLDDTKVPLPSDDVDREWISDTVFEVADGILGQGFEPTPSYAACSMCDYRIACPAAER